MTSINSSSPNCFISKMKADNSNLDTNNSTRFNMKKLLFWLWEKKLLCGFVLIALILVGIIFGLTTKDGKFFWTFQSKSSHCFFMCWLRTKALCSRKFQNVKLRLDFVKIWWFYRHSDFGWNHILANLKGPKMSFMTILETLNFEFC